LPAIDGMWEAINSFDNLAIAQQDTMSPLSEPPFSSHHLTQPRLSGFTREFNSPDVSCLDTRVRCVTESTHAPHHRQYDTMPAQLNELLPGFTQALRDAQDILFEVGLTALHVVLEDSPNVVVDLIGLPIDALVESKESLPSGATSATVHRFVKYSASREAPTSTPNTSTIAFEAHTDGTWFTVIPCSHVAGLEVASPTGKGWCSPEVQGQKGLDVAVLTGDFLQSITQYDFPSAVHRVVRPCVGSAARVSAPLLLRPSPAYRAACKAADERARKDRRARNK